MACLLVLPLFQQCRCYFPVEFKRESLLFEDVEKIKGLNRKGSIARISLPAGAQLGWKVF